MIDLSLIPLDDLLKEVENRTDCFICAYQMPKTAGSEMLFIYGRGEKQKYGEAVKLASILNNDVLNNWDGELKTLQDVHHERGEI